MDIIIKNVTGEPYNDWCIFELKRAGFPEGSVVRKVQYNSKSKSCQWISGTDYCIAWVGQTCMVKTIYFQSSVYRERLHSPISEDLGMAKCSMEMFLSDDDATARIEWILEYDDGSVDAEHIGLWFENKSLTDYDGVLSLPDEAKKLIRLCGFRIPRDFR